MGRTFGDMMSDGYEREGNWFKRQTPLKLIVKFAVAIVVISFVVGGIGFIGGWFRTATDVVSPQNVKAQWQFAYESKAQFESAARNWCSAKKLESSAVGEDAINERQSQTAAREAIYSKLVADYNARVQNVFELKIVKPDDVPTTAISLPDEITKLGLVCTG